MWLLIDRASRQIVAFHIGGRTKRDAEKLWKNIPDIIKKTALFILTFWMLTKLLFLIIGIEQWGKKQEVGKFGYATTGIYSFSELAANFNGYRFWNTILLKKKDPLKGVIGNFFNRPYVGCSTQIL